MTAQLGEEQFRVVAPNDVHAKLDSRIYVKLNTDNVIYFDRDSGKYITRHEQDSILNLGKNKR